MTSPRPSAFRRFCAAVVAAALVLQPAGLYATSIAEIPLQGLNPVKPNIMFTMDDSLSMSWNFLPDYIRDNLWCRTASGRQGRCSVGDPATTEFTSPPFRSSNFNKIYYDPTLNYAAGVTQSGVTLPHERTSPDTWTSVNVDGFAGYPGANSGGTINLTTGYPDEVWCWTDTPTATDLATAAVETGGNGSVCRRNGTAYPTATVAGVVSTAVPVGWNYPNAASGGCPDTATAKCVFAFGKPVTSHPYYYTISDVQFCSATDANGWGTGTCGSRWLPTQPNVKYGAGGFDPAVVARVDIVPSTPTYPSGRSYANEMRNFAKWYAFNHTRILAMKTAGGFAFSTLDDNSRVGFNTINTYLQNFLNVKDFTATNKTAWFTNFYSVVPAGSTPTIDAMARIGEYFSNRDTSMPGVIFTTAGPRPALPGAVDPLDAVTGRCQSNYHLMSTDGFSSQGARPYTGVAGAIGNQDQTVPAVLPGPIPGFTPGQPFPLPYREGPDSTSNRMADVAMYYWINDLRPELTDTVKDATAPWQHLIFYGLSIGAEGTLPYPTGIDDIISGSAVWPLALDLTPTSTDDLWHAAVNGRGKYFNVQNAQQLAESVVSSVADFTAGQSGTGTAVGIGGPQLTATNKYAYRTSYELDWWGDVRKYALDPATGALPIDANGNPLNAPLWAAAAQVDVQAAGTGWDTNRRILTINDSGNAAVKFRLPDLSATQQASLDAGWLLSGVTPAPSRQAVLDFLRGDKSNEGIGTSKLRVRTHVLGDFVYSGAVPVGAPSQPYDNAANPGYPAFAAAKRTRTPTVYVGGNDGMLHAFDDSSTVNAGTETWAFIPNALFGGGNPNDPSHASDPSFQLGALSYRKGGIPLFKHRFYVNATPRVWDVDFANTNTPTPPTSSNDWRTILVGGLGAGGRSVYALDVTTPVASTDTESTIAASGRVLWEFTEANLGYVFDAPTLVKTKRYGWVALVASGYNNPGGKGFLYVLNPKTGRLVDPIFGKIPLPNDAGNDADPTGLSTIRAFTASRKDPYVLQAYGGDLKGNVWRFDLSDADETKWKAELIATLRDPANKPQPITTGVRIEIDQNNNVDRYLFVGTGKLLDQADLGDSTVTNTLYVIRDGTRTAAEPAPATPYSRSNLNSVNGATVAGFSGPATGRGWYQDAADPKEKIAADVFADVQTVVYSFSKPTSDPCEATLTSNLFARDFNTGSSVLQSAGGAVVPSIDNIGAIAGVALIQGQAGTGSSASGDVRAQVTTMKGQVFSFGIKLAGAATLRHRVSWRLLTRD